MSVEARKSLASQILVGVAVALLAGGTAPWWWGEIARIVAGDSTDARADARDGSHPAQRAADAVGAYEAIQALYASARSLSPGSDCGEVRLLVEKIRVHSRDSDPVPPSFAYTVEHPQAKAEPTIGDLAADRIARIEQ